MKDFMALLFFCLQGFHLAVGRSHGSFTPRLWGGISQNTSPTTRAPKGRLLSPLPTSLQVSRGGASEQDEEIKEGAADDERYSRQVYTLGARAHRLVRTSTIYVDGPASSGLVYESIKNLALSGVGNIVLWNSIDSLDQQYHDASLDDLGKAYARAAREELELEQDSSVSLEQVLKEYTQRLNPAIKISSTERPQGNLSKNGQHSDEKRGVIFCIDRPYPTQVRLNEMARRHNLAFVAMETAGVYGRVFCDFGAEFEVYDSDGETPLLTPLDRIELSKDDDDTDANCILLINCMENEKHDASKGDKVQFQRSDGEVIPEVCTVTKVLTPHKIKVKLESSGMSPSINDFIQLVNEKAVAFSRVKQPKQLNFVSLQDAMQGIESDSGDLFTPCDFDKSFDDVRRSSILSCFQTLSSYVQQHGVLPMKDDFAKFEDTIDTSPSKESHHIKNFVDCCAAKLPPLQAMFGGIGAQEVLKAATGLYYPVRQILLYDCDEILPSRPNDIETLKTRTGLAYILGKKLQKRVKSSKLFVVGAGAIGCELLKNLVSMDFGTGKKGCISLTDMDTIEKSNLSRQLLFRDSNIGEFKSIAAHFAIHRFNPDVKMKVYTSKVGETDHGPFDENFWSENDIILNALDNMEARLFMDQQCVSNGKALVDAGTLGSKGNVQVVVPHQSESYGSSVDPPEPAIPVCTLKNFPYAIAHTIQWGRDLFDGLYQRRPRQANDLAPSIASSNPSEVAKQLIHDLGDDAALEAAIELNEDLSFGRHDASSQDAVKRDAIEWAVNLANRLFHKAIEDLLLEHPVDSKDEDGEPFWSGSRKVPTPISYAPDSESTFSAAANENLLDFVQAAARLRMEMLLSQEINCRVTRTEAAEALMKAEKSGSSAQAGRQVDREKLDTYHEVLTLVQLVSLSKNIVNFNEVEFEKDDETNGHVQFVNAASNLRAICYGIPPVDAMETRRIAGRIVPAMITTTAVVSALSCVELLKLLQKAPLARHRNAFINLALPFFAFTVPVAAEEIIGPGGRSFTVWDSINIQEKKSSPRSKGLTLKRLLRDIKAAVSDEPDNIAVSTVSAGQYMIYASFLHEDDKTMMRRSIWDLVVEALTEEEEFAGRPESEASEGGALTVDDRLLELTVTVEDTETGEEFELPLVKVHKYQTKAAN